MSEPQFEKLSYSIQEAVAATGIGRTSLFEDIKAGLLKTRKRGSMTLIMAEDLKSYLAALPAAEEAKAA